MGPTTVTPVAPREARGPDTSESIPPHRPQLRPGLPVLRRGSNGVQIGLDPGHGLVLTDVPAGLEAVLSRLDGEHEYSELMAAGNRAGLAVGVADAALRTLADAGLLTETVASSDHRSVRAGASASTEFLRARATVRLIGAGPLGRATGHGLVRAGIGRLEVSDGGEVDATLYPRTPLAGSRAEALRSELLDFGSPGQAGRESAIALGPHWSEENFLGDRTFDYDHDHDRASRPAPSTEPTSDLPTVTVVAADTTEVDRAITDMLLRADQPHLVLRPWLGGVLVGPLVLPGSTPCLSCLDLTRQAADPAWPQLLAQLVRRVERPDPAALAWAGATAALQLVGWLATGSTELLGSTVELTPPGFAVQVRRWDMHPGCGCSWPVTANWAP